MANVKNATMIRAAAAMGSIIALMGTGLAMPQAQAAPAPAPVKNQATIFTNTAAFCYRAPAIVRDNTGTTYAFAERRRHSCSDNGDFEIVMRKRTAAGVWSGITVVADDGKNRLSRPAPIYNPDNNSLVLLYSKATYKKNKYTVKARKTVGIYQKTSTDGGATWGAPSVAYKTYTVVGAGHGVYAGGGVMLAATGFNDLIRNASGVWTPGFAVPAGLVDGTLAPISSGYLACYRVKDTSIKLSHRCATVSADGKTVSAFSSKAHTTPSTVSVKAGLVSFLRAGKTWVLMSTPSNQTKKVAMAIYAAPVSTTKFGKAKVAVTSAAVAAGMSDLVQVDDTYAGIVLESGSSILYAEENVVPILK